MTIISKFSALTLLCQFSASHAFFTNNNSVKAPPSPKMDQTFTPPDTSDILEGACCDAAAIMKRALVPVPESISPTEEVGISYVHWAAQSKSDLPPLVLVHGFDSSCLEYRRLGSKLAAVGIDTYAVDILGWGFTKLNDVKDFSASAKVEALDSFVKTVVTGDDEGKFCIAGASLGGAAAIELASMHDKDTCEGLVLIDAQGFVDGVGPMAALPNVLAQAGVAVLKSVPLRNSANQMSYYDKETYATEDALNIGRLHCVQQGNQWNDAMVNFMKSGGFEPSSKIATIERPSLVLWGRQDGILDGEEFANKFIETLPNAKLQWIEECGHVPHLEQPEETAQAIFNFLCGIKESQKKTDAPSNDIFANLFR